MASRTRQQEVEEALTEALSKLAITLSVDQWTSERTALVTLNRRGFEVVYQMTWLPHVTLTELARIDQQDRGHRQLVTGPQVTGRTGDALRAAGIDYVDYAGNASLDSGPLLVDIRGRRLAVEEPSHRPSGASLFSARRMQVVFVLLTWPHFAGAPVRKIAEASGTSVGIAQSTLEIMRESGYLIGGSLRRREELVDLWAAAFRGPLSRQLRLGRYSGDIEKYSIPKGSMISGESAVEVMLQPRTLTIYTDHFDITDAIQNGWRASDDPNIEVRRKFWRVPDNLSDSSGTGVFSKSAVPPLLVYADLIAAREPRQSEVARTLRTENLV
ncbi:type IV toxin-antitoxin system AbiEi family antitoxin [Nocardia sp. NPDC055321]